MGDASGDGLGVSRCNRIEAGCRWAMKIDPNDPSKQIPDPRLAVIDLQSSPPKVIAQRETGKSPSGLPISRQGNLALVANRAEGTVSVFGTQGKEVTNLGTIQIGDEKSGVSHVALSADGKTAMGCCALSSS